MSISIFLIFSFINILTVLLGSRLILKQTWKEIGENLGVYIMLLILGPIGTGILVLAFICSLILTYLMHKKKL